MGAADTANILDKYREKKKEKKADTLIFPNEDFIYVMKWKEKKNTTILKIYLCLRKSWENKYFNQRNIPLKILNVF